MSAPVSLPVEIDYFEAHGTGTAVGDPLETRAIGEALGRHRPRNKPLPIGSIKGNIGHLEAAAGMAGLFKALHVLRDRRVPANLHLDAVNPNIDVADWNLAPVMQRCRFRARPSPRRRRKRIRFRRHQCACRTHEFRGRSRDRSLLFGAPGALACPAAIVSAHSASAS